MPAVFESSKCFVQTYEAFWGLVIIIASFCALAYKIGFDRGRAKSDKESFNK
jgi:hypothetical protein